MWRGGFRLHISVSASFVWRCLSGVAMTPFPHFAGWDLHPLESAALSRRTPIADIASLAARYYHGAHGPACPAELYLIRGSKLPTARKDFSEWLTRVIDLSSPD